MGNATIMTLYSPILIFQATQSLYKIKSGVIVLEITAKQIKVNQHYFATIQP